MATKPATISVIKFKSCTTLLHMLLVRIGSYVKSVPRYKIFSFGYLSSGHTIFMWARMRGPVLTFEPKRGLRAKSFRNTTL